MMKKIYIKPKMQVVMIRQQGHLMTGSNKYLNYDFNKFDNQDEKLDFNFNGFDDDDPDF